MTTRPLAAALVASLAVVARAQDTSVDLELRGNDKVSGTLRPAFAAELFGCRVARGSTIAATVKSKIKGLAAPPFEVRLTRDGLAVSDAVFAAKGAAAALAPYAVAESGLYRVEVTGDGAHDGDFELALSVKPSKSSALTGGTLANGDAAEFTFGAPAGAAATVEVKPVPGSGFVGVISGVVHPNGDAIAYVDSLGKRTFSVLGTGDVRIGYRNDGASGGFAVAVKLKLPKLAKGKLDIRDGALTTRFGDEPNVFGRVLGDDGGTLDPAGAGSPLEGSSIAIPPGVLGGAVLLTISSAPSIPDQGGRHAAGPAVEFGPTGRVFDPTGSDPSKQAVLTIPFDPAAFPNGTDSMVIFVRDAAGTVTEVPKPYTIGANTVSFATPHLSSYQVQSPESRPFAGEFVALEVINELEDSFGGRFGFGLHAVSVAEGTANVAKDGLAVTWTANGEGGFVDYGFESDVFQVAAAADPADDSTVLVADPDSLQPPSVFRRGADGDVLVEENGGVVLLRRAAASPSVALLAGRWHVIRVGAAARQLPGFPAVARLEFSADRAVVDLVADGTVKFRSITGGGFGTDFPAGTWEPFADAGAPASLTWEVVDGVIRLHTSEGEGPDDVRLLPVVRGDVLVGRTPSPGGEPSGEVHVDTFVFVRAASGFSPAAAAADYTSVANTVMTRPTDTRAQGVLSVLEHLAVTLPPNGAATHQGTQVVMDHELDGTAAAIPVDISPSAAGRFAIRPDGSFTADVRDSGAFTEDGLSFVRLRLTEAQVGLAFATRLPPPAAKGDR